MYSRRISLGLLAFLAAGPQAAHAATTINKVTYEGNAAAAGGALAPDQALRLKKIFLFPSTDDLSGAMAPRLDDKLVSLFGRNTRFELIRDPQVVKALSPDESSYYKVAQNQSVHQEAAKAVGADTTVLLRTRNIGPNTQMTLELRDATGALLFSEEGLVPGIASWEARGDLIEKLYKQVLERLPFEGTVTGRTAKTLTIDLGMGSIRQGEELEIARIVSLRRHPLLGTVVGTDYVRTGRARVTNVDRVLSFAEVIEEFPGEAIAPGQKVLRTRAQITRSSGQPEAEEPPRLGRPRKSDEQEAGEAKAADPFDDRLKGDFDKPKPRFGKVGAEIGYGTLSYAQSSGGTATDYSGSGLGGDLLGELWVTRSWVLSGSYGFQSAKLSGAGGSLGSSSWSSFTFLAGYRIFPENLAEGISLTASFGYQTMNFSVPGSTALSVGGKKYGGLLIRAESEISFLDQQSIGVGFEIQPFTSFTEVGPSLGAPSGGTVIGIMLGWNKQLVDELWFRIGLRYSVANGSYENSSTVSNKRFAIGPGIYYLF